MQRIIWDRRSRGPWQNGVDKRLTGVDTDRLKRKKTGHIH